LPAPADLAKLPQRVQPAQLVSALEEVAARLGIEVRYDTMDRNHPLGGAGGGFCRLRGKPMILLDSRLAPHDRVAVLAKALARFDLDAMLGLAAIPIAFLAYNAVRVQDRQATELTDPEERPGPWHACEGTDVLKPGR
jgi:hypothetical protein